VDVGAANARTQHANENIVDSDRRLRNILEPQTLFGMSFDQRFQLQPP